MDNALALETLHEYASGTLQHSSNWGKLRRQRHSLGTSRPRRPIWLTSPPCLSAQVWPCWGLPFSSADKPLQEQTIPLMWMNQYEGSEGGGYAKYKGDNVSKLPHLYILSSSWRTCKPVHNCGDARRNHAMEQQDARPPQPSAQAAVWRQSPPGDLLRIQPRHLLVPSVSRRCPRPVHLASTPCWSPKSRHHCCPRVCWGCLASEPPLERCCCLLLYLGLAPTPNAAAARVR